MTDKAALMGWTIYDHPKDYPEYFVARRWVAKLGVVIATNDTLIASTLEDLRAKLPRGLTLTPRMAQDDPVIVEVWL